MHYAPDHIKTMEQLCEALSKDEEVLFQDPSVFLQRHYLSSEMKPGESLLCTNNPRRSWYASVHRTATGWKVNDWESGYIPVRACNVNHADNNQTRTSSDSQDQTERVDCVPDEYNMSRYISMTFGRYMSIGLCVRVLLLFLFSATVYLFISGSDHFVVDPAGNPEGIANNIRALLQGQRFWQDQLHKLDEEIKTFEAKPIEWDKIERTLEELSKKLDRETNEELERVYTRHPELRPTLAQREAQALRDRADAIEAQEHRAAQAKAWEDRLEALKAIRNVVESKAMK